MVASVESLDYEAIVFDLRYDVNIAVESDDEDERALNEDIVELNSLLSRVVSETCGQRNSEIEILLKLFWDLFQRARFDEAWNVLDAIDPIDLLNDGQMINWLIYNIQFLILDFGYWILDFIFFLDFDFFCFGTAIVILKIKIFINL